MKYKDRQILRELSQAVVDTIPSDLVVDGNKNIYMDKEPVSFLDVMTLIEEALEKAVDLNNIIQGLQGRKSSDK